MRKRGRGRGIYAGQGSVVVGMGIAGLRRRIVRWIRAVKKSLVYARVEEDLVGLLSLHNPRYRHCHYRNLHLPHFIRFIREEILYEREKYRISKNPIEIFVALTSRARRRIYTLKVTLQSEQA